LLGNGLLVIRDAAARELAGYADDPIMTGLSEPIGDWVVETLIQGAWMREYHEWEKATKSYFEGHHTRNGSAKPDWKGKVRGINGAASHVDRVRAQLALFGATSPDASIAVLDKHRRLINAAKHEEEYFATEQDYRDLVSAISQFWNDLAPQEEFTLKALSPPPMAVPQLKK
jgi:hypothetical protein